MTSKRDEFSSETVILIQNEIDSPESGEVTPPEEACISPLDRGFLYGDAVFETFRCYDGEPAFLEEHTERLNESLDTLKIPADFSPGEVERIIERLLDALEPEEDAYVRISITRGERDGMLTPTEGSPTLVGMAKPLEKRRYEPATAEIVETRRPGGELCRLKTHNYLPNVLAKLETDVDEALMKDAEGRIASGAVSNLFVLRNGRLNTPAENMRKGVTREFVLETARHLGLATGVSSVESLDGVEAAFLTNSTWGVRPVERIGDRQLDVENQWVERLADEYFERVIP
ncbi:MAG: aminotransferase class IV [Halobacteria archaeon]|nr:aminotransferase class IV [Halobacteria archaeon]